VTRRRGVRRHERLARLGLDETAFTLLETLLSMAITTLVLGAIVVIIYQFNTLTRRQSDAMLVSQQMGNLSTVLSKDVVSAREGVVSEDGAQFTLYLVRYDFGQDTDPITMTVVYQQSGTELWRTEGEATRRVARYVDTVDFGPAGPLPATVQVTITTALREESLPSVLRFERRSVEGQW
jgi:hypothetical protein